MKQFFNQKGLILLCNSKYILNKEFIIEIEYLLDATSRQSLLLNASYVVFIIALVVV